MINTTRSIFSMSSEAVMRKLIERRAFVLDGWLALPVYYYYNNTL